MSRQQTSRTSDHVNTHIGERIRQRRLSIEMAGVALEHALDAAPGTVARYENGTKGIGAGQLFLLGRALDVPVSYFFDGLPTSTHETPVPNMEMDKEMNRFLRLYTSLPDSELRKRLFNLVKSVADGKLLWR